MKRKAFYTTIFAFLALFAISTIVFAQDGGLVENFDDPELPVGWDRTPGVEIRDGVLYIPPENFVVVPRVWGDMELRLSLRRMAEGNFVISYGANEEGSFHLVSSVERISLQYGSGGQLDELAAGDVEPIPAGEWFQVTVRVEGGEHHISVNGHSELVTEYPAQAIGGVSFETFPETGIEVDSVEIIGEEHEGQQVAETEPAAQPTSQQAETSTDKSAGTNSELRWVRLGGPPGGTGYDIRYNFDDPNIWYVTDAHGGVHISTDNGYTWQASNSGIPGQSGTTGDAIGIFCLTVDPHNPQIIWAGTIDSGHVYRSTDGGQSWEERDNGITIKYDILTFRGITVDPSSSDIVYAMAETTSESATEQGQGTWKSGTGGVVYKTTDAGENWEIIWEGDMPSSLARYLWVDPRDTDVLYVSTGIFDRGAVGDNDSLEEPFGGLGILKSTNGGETWRVLDQENGLRHLYIGSLYMHPENPDVLLAAAGHLMEPDTLPYLQRLEGEGEPSPMGIYRTTDGGENWTQTLAGFEVFSSVEICPSDPDIVYASSGQSVYRSEDSGVTWTVVARPWGPPSITVGFPIDMQCDPRDTNRVFVNNYGGGNFLSEDGGKTWVNASQGYTGAQIFGLSINPSEANRVYVAGFGGLWRSDDSGVTWYGLQNPPENMGVLPSQGIAVDPTNSDHVLIAKHEIMETLDGGKSWTERWSMNELINQGIPEELLNPAAPVIEFAPSDAKTVYIGFGHENCLLSHESVCESTQVGIALSRDGGKSWKLSGDEQIRQLNIFDIGIDYRDANHAYAATGAGLFQSLDGGENWTVIPGVLENEKVHALAVSPSDAQQILVGVDRDGIYRSTDGGETWEHVIAGLEPNGSVHDIVFDPTNSQIVYASDLYSGVYKSTDHGSTWTKINEGLQSRATRSLAISSDGQRLYVGTNEDGVLRLDLNGEPPESAEGAEEAEEAEGAEEPEEQEGAEGAEEAEEPEVTEESEKPGLPCLGGLLPLGFLGLVLSRRRRSEK